MKNSKRFLSILTLISSFAFATTVDATTYSASENQLQITGIQNNTDVGVSMAVLDMNSDTYPDMVVGFYDETNETMDAALFYGSADGFSDNMTVNDADTIFNGAAESGYNNAIQVAAAGDVDNDGYEDVLIANSFAESRAGSVFLVYGMASRYTGNYNLETMNDARVDRFDGEAATDYAGGAIHGGSDINGDGYDDVLIGANWNNSKRGAVYLIYGDANKHAGTTVLNSADVKWTGQGVDNQLGSTITSGDINGDGYDDIIMTAEQYDAYTGRVYVFYGSAEGLGNAIAVEADAIFDAEETNDGLGATLDIANVNGDGYDDLLIGASQQNESPNDTSGGFYVLYGEEAPFSDTSMTFADVKFTIAGKNALDYQYIHSAGDFNGDGYDDIAISDIETTAGTVYILNGSADRLSPDIEVTENANVILNGVLASEGFGISVIPAEMNGDQFAELFVGSTNGELNGDIVGAFYRFSLSVDVDGDGELGEGGLILASDCDDTNAEIYQEQLYYRDADGDGLGSSTETTSVCSLTAPEGYVDNDDDTDDSSLGTLASYSINKGVVTLVYDSGYTQTVTPFKPGAKIKVTFSSDKERFVTTNGKTIKVFFEGEEVDKKRLYKKKSQRVVKSKLKVVSIYPGYDTVAYLSTRKLKGRLAVLRLKSNHTFAKLKKKKVMLERKKPIIQKLKIKKKKKRIITRFDKGENKVVNKWKLLKKGKLKMI